MKKLLERFIKWFLGIWFYRNLKYKYFTIVFKFLSTKWWNLHVMCSIHQPHSYLLGFRFQIAILWLQCDFAIFLFPREVK